MNVSNDYRRQSNNGVANYDQSRTCSLDLVKFGPQIAESRLGDTDNQLFSDADISRVKLHEMFSVYWTACIMCVCFSDTVSR